MNPFKKALTVSLLTLSIGHAMAAENTTPEHQTQAFLNALAAGSGKPLEQMSPKDARAVLTGAQNSVKVDMSGVQVSEKTIKVDNQDIKLTIVRPIGAKGQLPAFMYFHGGGWVLGDYPTHARLIRDLVVRWRSTSTTRHRRKRIIPPRSIRRMRPPAGWPSMAGKSMSTVRVWP